MNDKFLHITNSLNDQYPPADIPEDIAWAEMRKLLDDDDDMALPPPPPPMPPNGNGYWKYGLLLLLIMIAGIAVYVNRNKTQSVQTAGHEENTAEQNKNITQSLNSNDSLEKNNSNNPVGKLVTKQQTNTKATTDQAIEKNIQPANKNNSVPASENPTGRNNNHTTRSHTKVKKSGGDIGENNDGIAATEITDNNKTINKPKKITSKGVVVNSSVAKSKTLQPINNNDQNISESNVNNENEKNTTTLNSTTTTTDNIAVLHDSSTVKNADSLKKQLANTNKPEKNETDTTPVNDKKNKKIALAAGLGINQFFTIAGQQHSDYNSSGTVGAISDYIPVPFVRMYFNKKLYLQIEAQFNTPQYTKQLLAQTETIYDTTGPVPVTSQNSTYINKLFYFNLPLSIHYSPFNNFYIGAGLQFSQLKNGVGLFENKLYNSSGTDSLSKTKYASIKKDSAVYQEIKTIEWRVLLDANYQWKNLVFGLRYNQALSNFINIQISSTQVTQARNSSLQLYLRYILWKNKKAKELFPK